MSVERARFSAVVRGSEGSVSVHIEPATGLPMSIEEFERMLATLPATYERALLMRASQEAT